MQTLELESTPAPAPAPPILPQNSGKRDKEEAMEGVHVKKQKLDEPIDHQNNGSTSDEEKKLPADPHLYGYVTDPEEIEEKKAREAEWIASMETFWLSDSEHEKKEEELHVVDLTAPKNKVESSDNDGHGSVDEETKATPVYAKKVESNDNNIEEDYWDSLDEETKAALIAHEREAVESSDDDGGYSDSNEVKIWETPECSGSKTLIASNLACRTTIGHIKSFFCDFGRTYVRRHGHCARIRFANAEVAAKAMELNGKPLRGRSVSLKTTGIERAVCVRGFDIQDVEDQIRSSLWQHFQPCGNIRNIYIGSDTKSGAPKGFAYIFFADTYAVTAALELHKSEFRSGCYLKVRRARKMPRDEYPYRDFNDIDYSYLFDIDECPTDVLAEDTQLDILHALPERELDGFHVISPEKEVEYDGEDVNSDLEVGRFNKQQANIVNPSPIPSKKESSSKNEQPPKNKDEPPKGIPAKKTSKRNKRNKKQKRKRKNLGCACGRGCPGGLFGDYVPVATKEDG